MSVHGLSTLCTQPGASNPFTVGSSNYNQWIEDLLRGQTCIWCGAPATYLVVHYHQGSNGEDSTKSETFTCDRHQNT